MEFLRKFLPYILVLRPKNLAIIAFTLAILQYGVIHKLSHAELVLQGNLFWIFTFIALIIAGTGNLVNDIFDREIDLVNKPNETYVSTFISVSNAWKYYFFLHAIGLLLACFVAHKTGQLYNIWIYPAVSISLYYYAKKWKSTLLWGNILISAFVAFIWGILFYAQFTARGQNDSYRALTMESRTLLELCISYMVFAFLINLIREIIKDIEDMEGDQKSGLITYPISKGIQPAKKLIVTLLLILNTVIIIWIFTSSLTTLFEERFFYLIFVIAPIGYLVQKILSAREKKDYTYASKVIKLIMIFSLSALFFIQY